MITNNNKIKNMNTKWFFTITILRLKVDKTSTTTTTIKIYFNILFYYLEGKTKGNLCVKCFFRFYN